MKLVRHCCEELTLIKGAYRPRLYRVLSDVYAAALAFDQSREKWQEFIDDEFWQRRKRKPKLEADTQRILRYVLRFVCGTSDRSEYLRAYKYACALKQFAEERVEPEDIPDLIEEGGGIEFLCKKARRDVHEETEKEQEDEDEDWDVPDGGHCSGNGKRRRASGGKGDRKRSSDMITREMTVIAATKMMATRLGSQSSSKSR